MDSIHDMLIKRARRQGMETAITATIIIEAANRVLPSTAKAKTFNNGVLYVEASSGAEAYLFKQELVSHLECVNAALPEPVVKELKVRIKH